MLVLHYKADTSIPIEAEAIRPDGLKGLSLAEIMRLPVQHGNTAAPLGEFFDVEGDAGDAVVRIEGDCRRVKWLGAGMSEGRLIVSGDAGMHLGAEMRGGVIEVHGSAGDWVGAEMSGGRIHVHGSAGHLVGAAYRGSRAGMRGGTILIEGDAGNEIAACMRRGLIAVGGDAGDFTAVDMIAGTVFVFGRPGLRPAAGMKRGTVACFEPNHPPVLLPSFRYDCRYRPVWLGIYLRQLSAWNFPLPHGADSAIWQRYRGDFVSLGKGEVLHRLE